MTDFRKLTEKTVNEVLEGANRAATASGDVPNFCGVSAEKDSKILIGSEIDYMLATTAANSDMAPPDGTMQYDTKWSTMNLINLPKIKQEGFNGLSHLGKFSLRDYDAIEILHPFSVRSKCYASCIRIVLRIVSINCAISRN